MYKRHKELSPLKKKTTQPKPGRAQDRHLSRLLQAGCQKTQREGSLCASHCCLHVTSALIETDQHQKAGPTGSRGRMERPRSDRSKPRVPSRGPAAGTGPPRTVPPSRRAGDRRPPTLALTPHPIRPGNPPAPAAPGGKYRSAGSVLVTPFPGSHGNRRPGLGFCQHLETQIRRISRSWQRSVSTARFVAPGVSGTRTQRVSTQTRSPQ